ncbi:chaplin family protein [Streptomyces sp. NPDC045470]|uniref:chaplin n=1 Tax=Streptomyces sp. NPDC045470 TaxID=3155469 RepID=UPI0033D250E8
MQHLVKHSVLVAATAPGILAGAEAGAHADSGAAGRTAAVPGVLAGNLLQAPVHLPVSLCGNTVNVIGLLDPVFGNHCADLGGHHHPPGHQPPGHKPPGNHPPGHQSPGHKPPGSHQPPGQKPPGHRPTGHEVPSSPGPGHRPPTDVAGEVDSRVPPAASTAGGEGRVVGQAAPVPALAHTGSEHLGAAAAASGVLLLGGVALVRRWRSLRA